MAQDIVGSLFGVAQPVDYADQDYRAAVALANANSPKQMGRFLGGMIGAPLGRAAGQAIGGLFGAEDPRLKQQRLIEQAKQQGFDTTSPEGLQQLGQFFIQNNAPELASRTALLRNQMLESQATIQQKTREKLGSPTNQAEQIRLNQLQAQFGPEMGAQKFIEEQELSKRRVAAAGAPASGQVPLASLATAQNIVQDYTKAPAERLRTIGEAQVYLTQSGVNPAAVPQLRRALVKLGGGDSQVAQREVQQIAGSLGIAGNVAEAVNQFFTGRPTAEQLTLIGQVVKGAEDYYANQYNRGRQQAATVLSEGKINPQTQAALLPPEYKPAGSRNQYPNAPKVGTIQGGYKYKGGNPADPNSWEKI